MTPLRSLPSIHALLATPEAAALAATYSRPALRTALRTALAHSRSALAAGLPAHDPLAHAATLLATATTPTLRRVINATGILLHTNLGRAPLAPEALAALTEAAAYSNLELDLATNTRSDRLQSVLPLLRQLTGAPAALVTNNNAAATLLALAPHTGGEIIVSRGELVEIGGSFRLPDIIAQSGARLVEVGTTNRTRAADYARAITPNSRALLKVHPSNYRIEGFTEAATLTQLSPLARAHHLLLIDDQGTGNLTHPGSPTMAASLASGADLVLGSGDKLLGGPQSGLLAGTDAAIAPLRHHPLYRALRPGKLQLAALEATLRLHLTAPHRIPILAMLAQSEATLEARAEALLALLTRPAHIAPTTAYAGGGTLPTDAINSRALLIPDPHLDALAHRLRTHHPAILPRLAHNHLILDMLAIQDPDLPLIATALNAR